MLMVENDWFLIVPSLRRVAVGLGALSSLFKHVVKVPLTFAILMFMGHWVFRRFINPFA